jgi:CBS domain containing-hemolysin-like protein
LSVKDVIGAIASDNMESGDSVTKNLRPVYFAPEAKPIALLFEELRGSGNQIAIVVDDNGGVSGIVTLKQLLEVIVGDFGEEGQPATEGFVATGFEQYELSASMSIQEVNEKLDLGLVEGDYQTLAGYILKQLGHIPNSGDYFYHGALRFEVKTMRRLRIEQVEVRRIYQKVKPDTS